MSLSSLPTALLLPPMNLVIGVAIGVLALKRFHRPAKVLIATCLILLLALSLPVTSKLLVASLEADLPARDPQALAAGGPPPGAVVVLSGEMKIARPAGGILPGPGLGALTLERERAGIVLARRTGLPLLMSGGVLEPGMKSIAAIMAEEAERDFATPGSRIEGRSIDTWENAQFSAGLLAQDGITRVYLVTHAWHMRRSLMVFAHFGIDAVPAATYLDTYPTGRFDEFVPSIAAWHESYYAIHEWIGCLAYWARINL